MCGIVGYIGGRKVSDVLIKGLKQLEYRGYDSCGVALINGTGSIQVDKKQGRIQGLDDSLSAHPIEGAIGIGHTRWATHGHPSHANSHPHLDESGEIAIVHNGIIENYSSIRIELESKGVIFKSETDTETVVHLIADGYKNGAKTLVKAIQYAIKKVVGQYAICCISSREPDKMVVVRKGAPLILGVGEDENFVMSDVSAFLCFTKKVVYLEDGEIAVVTRNSVSRMDLEGNEIELGIKEIEWDLEQAEKGGFETYMLKEIHEQPEALKRTYFSLIGKGKHEIEYEGEELTKEKLLQIDKIHIVSCGTAYYAGLAGKYFLDAVTSIDSQTDYSAEFRYRHLKLDKNKLLITITQSGETADTLASLRVAKEMGSPVLSVVNVRESTIARESNHVLYTIAGPEIGVASTKAYTCQIMTMNMLGLLIGHLRGDISNEKREFYVKEISELPAKVEQVLENTSYIQETAKIIVDQPSAFYLGRQFNFPTALEGALKNKEISYMHCEGYSAGEMKHGPIALIKKGFPVVNICTDGPMYDKMVSNIKEVSARGAYIITVATEGDTFLKTISDRVIYVPKTIEELTPTVNIIPMQLLAYYIARLRECDIDKPRNLAKSVTVE